MRNSKKRMQLALMVFSILALFFCVSCDNKEDQEQKEIKAKSTKSLLRFVPDQEYFSLGFVDIDELIASDQIQQVIDMYPALELWNEKLGVGIEEFHQLAMALEFPNIYEHNSNGLIVLSTELNEEELLESIGEKKGFFDKKKVGNYVLYNSGPEFSFSYVDNNTVIIGSTSMVKKSLEVANGKAKSIIDGDNMEYFEDYLGNEDSVWIGLSGIHKVFRELADENVMFKNFTTIKFAYLGIQTGDEFRVRLIAECDKEKNAGRLAGGLRSLIGIFSSIIDLQGFNFDTEDDEEFDLEQVKELVNQVVDNTEIRSDGNKVIISLTVPQSMIDLFLEMSRSALLDANSSTLPDDMTSNNQGTPLSLGVN